MIAPKWAVALVEHLTEMAKPDSPNPNRAALAHLRRGVDGPLDYILSRVGWLFRRVPNFALENAVCVSGLFAWVKGDCPHQRPKPDSGAKQTDGPNFGAAFGAGLTLEQKQQREKRFIDLLETDREELPYKLRQALALICRDKVGRVKVGLDWVLLVWHLGHWSDPDRRVQKAWARGFWAAATEEEPTAASEEPIAE